MTLIEFYDKDAVKNVCSSLVAAPERVVLVGDKIKTMQRCAERYQAVLAARGVDGVPLPRRQQKPDAEHPGRALLHRSGV